MYGRVVAAWAAAAEPGFLVRDEKYIVQV